MWPYMEWDDEAKKNKGNHHYGIASTKSYCEIVLLAIVNTLVDRKSNHLQAPGMFFQTTTKVTV